MTYPNTPRVTSTNPERTFADLEVGEWFTFHRTTSSGPVGPTLIARKTSEFSAFRIDHYTGSPGFGFSFKPRPDAPVTRVRIEQVHVVPF